MLREGDRAPDFALKDQNGEEVRLSDFRGRPVVLYFYPKDNTSGCTKEACGFRDLNAEFGQYDAVVLGVSPDGVKSHEKFSNKLGLPFRILSDEGKEVAQAYEVWKEKSMYGRKYLGVERTTFVIDGDGCICKIFPRVKVPGHPEAVLAFLQELA